MATEWGKLVPTICDRSYVRLTFLETNRLVPKVFVQVGPTACVLTIPAIYMYRMLMKNCKILWELLTVVMALMNVN